MGSFSRTRRCCGKPPVPFELLTGHKPKQGGRAVSALDVRCEKTLFLRRDAAATFVGVLESRLSGRTELLGSLTESGGRGRERFREGVVEGGRLFAEAQVFGEAGGFDTGAIEPEGRRCFSGAEVAPVKHGEKTVERLFAECVCVGSGGADRLLFTDEGQAHLRLAAGGDVGVRGFEDSQVKTGGLGVGGNRLGGVQLGTLKVTIGELALCQERFPRVRKLLDDIDEAFMASVSLSSDSGSRRKASPRAK